MCLHFSCWFCHLEAPRRIRQKPTEHYPASSQDEMQLLGSPRTTSMCPLVKSSTQCSGTRIQILAFLCETTLFLTLQMG